MSAILFFGGCYSKSEEKEKSSPTCATCNMKISDSKLYTSSLVIKSKTHYFDDIGCMIIFSKENQLDLENIESNVFTNDTKEYIASHTAHYKIDEKTPMSYGFGAYKNVKSSTIPFKEVVVKMLRGEHMANPKIRKQILGNENAR